MRYGREYNPIDPAQVETPECGVNTFVSSEDFLLYGKFMDGSVKLLSSAASSALAADAINEGTADAVEASITGVVAYNNGDAYYINLPETNTGAMTIDINGIGVVDINFGGDLAIAMAAGKIIAGTVNVFIFDGTNFNWAGYVDGDKVVYNGTITKADLDANAGGSSSRMDIALPASSKVDFMAAKAGATEFAGGAATAVDMTVTDTASAGDYFGGGVNLFTGATAAGEGGWSTGIGKIAGVVPSIMSKQTKRFAIAVTGDQWANLTGGDLEVVMHWSPVPW